MLIRGRNHYTKWTNSTGVYRCCCAIIAETMEFLSAKKEGEDPQFNDRNDRDFQPASAAENAVYDTESCARARSQITADKTVVVSRWL